MSTKPASLPAVELQDTVRRGDVQLVDVRSATEFRAGHIPRGINVPLEEIEARLDDLDRTGTIALVCQSGQRAAIAAGWLRARSLDCTVVEGGTNAWIAAGLPLVRSVRSRWSLERQVRLGAGLLIAAGTSAAASGFAIGLLLCGFVACGLVFAGLTDFCAMGRVLAKMPWNRAVE